MHVQYNISFSVCYIAGELVRHLREQLESQREEVQTFRAERGRKRKRTQTKSQLLQNRKRRKLNDSPKCLESMKKLLCIKDEYCIRVAALCHDLGMYT